MKRTLFLFVCLLAYSWTALAFADNWPQWRGPTNTGICSEKNLPKEWSESQNIAWKVELPGIGGATPAIWGDRIFVTSGEDKDLVLLCFDTAGKQLWKQKVSTAGRLVIRTDEGNETSASPSTDGKHVFVFVGSGDFACYDFSGKEVWKVNLQDKYGKFSIQHGMHSTPLLHEDRLYVNLLHANGHWVIAFDKATGKELWKVHRKSDANGESKEAYTSPLLAKSGSEHYIVVHGADYTTGHRLSDGQEIWRLVELNPQGDKYQTAFRIIASPVVSDDLIVVPTCRGQLVVALKPSAIGTIKPGVSHELWRNKTGAPDVPSPLIHGGIVYLCRENGALQALDAKTGEELYNQRLFNGRHRASPVLADGKLYLTARDGEVNVVEPGKNFKKLASNKLADVFAASPAVAQGRIYLRGFKHLYAISEGGK